MSDWLDPDEHGDFSAGMIQDAPRHMLPRQAVWDAQDCFINEDGTLHKRGSTVTALSSASVASASVIGYSQLDHDDASLVRGYVVDESAGAGVALLVYGFTPGSGTFAASALPATQTLTSGNGLGRPFMHNGYLVVPVRPPSAQSSSVYRPAVIMGGGVGLGQAIAGTGASTVITAGSKTITGFAAGDVSSMGVGDIISITKSAANNRYMGRVTKVSGTTASVTPTPTQSWVGPLAGSLGYSAFHWRDFNASGTTSFRGAQCGASWQNRCLFAAVPIEIAAASFEWHPNRIIWSLLPTETASVNTTADGDLWLSNYGFPVSNYLDVPWMDFIRGLEPVSDGEMLVLGRPQCSRLVGTLNTNTTTSGGLTYELRPVNQKIQCVNDKATVRTPSGVMMMGPDGIYLYRDGNFINTMVGRIQSYFLTNIANATIYGAGALQNNHYYISTSAGMLVCNMDGFRWTRFQNVDLANNFFDPQDTTRIFSCRYQPGTSSNTTKIVRQDYLLNPSSSATTDVSGTGPLMSVQTRIETEGEASQLKQWRHAKVAARMPGSTGTLTITETPGLDGEESSTSLGTLSNATSVQVARYDRTTLSRGYGLTIAQTGNPNECELVDVDYAARALNPKRTS